MTNGGGLGGAVPGPDPAGLEASVSHGGLKPHFISYAGT